MIDNTLYNLCRQLTEENTGLWRIKNEYISDAGSNSEIVAFWKKLEQDKVDHVNELRGLIKKFL